MTEEKCTHPIHESSKKLDELIENLQGNIRDFVAAAPYYWNEIQEEFEKHNFYNFLDSEAKDKEFVEKLAKEAGDFQAEISHDWCLKRLLQMCVEDLLPLLRKLSVETQEQDGTLREYIADADRQALLFDLRKVEKSLTELQKNLDDLTTPKDT